MLSGQSVKESAASKVGLSATLNRVPRDRDTIGKSELSRVKPMIYKHGLIVQTQQLSEEFSKNLMRESPLGG